MANVNFDDMIAGNSLKSSQFSDLQASKLKYEQARMENMGAYGEQPVSFKHNYGNGPNTNMQGKSLINIG